MTNDFVFALEQTARLLARFSTRDSPTSLRWDGRAYTAGTESRFDPFAAIWWSRLSAMAELLSRQDGPLSGLQAEYLAQTLFGGMGSLNDLQVDESRVGPEAGAANQELDRLRKVLFEEFRRTVLGLDSRVGNS